MKWEPISKAELLKTISDAERRMTPQLFRLWEAIKIPPEKWSEAHYGSEGGGFWVVALIGRKAIWFNDIEDGFNCSLYTSPGQLAEYFCDQDELELAVRKVLSMIETN